MLLGWGAVRLVFRQICTLAAPYRCLHLVVELRRIDGDHLFALGIPEHLKVAVAHGDRTGQGVCEVKQFPFLLNLTRLKSRDSRFSDRYLPK